MLCVKRLHASLGPRELSQLLDLIQNELSTHGLGKVPLQVDLDQGYISERVASFGQLSRKVLKRREVKPVFSAMNVSAEAENPGDDRTLAVIWTPAEITVTSGGTDQTWQRTARAAVEGYVHALSWVQRRLLWAASLVGGGMAAGTLAPGLVRFLNQGLMPSWSTLATGGFFVAVSLLAPLLHRDRLYLDEKLRYAAHDLVPLLTVIGTAIKLLDWLWPHFS